MLHLRKSILSAQKKEENYITIQPWCELSDNIPARLQDETVFFRNSIKLLENEETLLVFVNILQDFMIYSVT